MSVRPEALRVALEDCEPRVMDITHTTFVRELLDPEEELALFRCLEAATYASHLLSGNPGRWNRKELQAMIEAGKQARRRLFSVNLRLVMKLASVEARRWRAELDDLFQEGCLALGEAMERFDHARGTRFSTLVHRYVTRAVRRRARLTSVSSDVARRRDGSRVRVLWTPLDVLPEGRIAVEDELEQVEGVSWDVLDLLGRAGWVLRMRYGIGTGTAPMTRAALSRKLGVSPSTIRRLEENGLATVRDILEGDRCRLPGTPQAA